MAAHQSTRPEWFRLRLVQSGPAGGGIETQSDSARSDGGQDKVHTHFAITAATLVPYSFLFRSSFSYQLSKQKVKEKETKGERKGRIQF